MTNEETNGTTDPDLSEAIGGVSPADQVEQIQRETEQGLEQGDEQAEKLKDIQGALRKTFGVVEQIASQVRPELEHSDEELDNLAVLWSKVLEDMPRRRLAKFMERLPLVSALGYTVVTTGTKARDALQAYRREQQSAELEQIGTDQ